MQKVTKIIATFSIVAFDPETDSLGVAVQSKFLAVGSVVPWARAGVGAVATQAMANYNYGPRGLELMAQGNILVGGETVEAMARTYEEADGDLAARLLSALDAGQAAGGDSRGKQSAALLVVREGGGYGGDNDRGVDLRVDDHPDPIRELVRIRDLHTLYFGETRARDVVAVDGDVRGQVAEALRRSRYIEGPEVDDDALFDALSAYIRTENFEEREQERGYLDRAVLEYMKGDE